MHGSLRSDKSAVRKQGIDILAAALRSQTPEQASRSAAPYICCLAACAHCALCCIDIILKSSALPLIHSCHSQVTHAGSPSGRAGLSVIEAGMIHSIDTGAIYCTIFCVVQACRHLHQPCNCRLVDARPLSWSRPARQGCHNTGTDARQPGIPCRGALERRNWHMQRSSLSQDPSAGACPGKQVLTLPESYPQPVAIMQTWTNPRRKQ